MKKRHKYISYIVCLVLCVTMIVFGVYAAYSKVNPNFSSDISFNPSSAKLKVMGYIAGCTAPDESQTNYYACNYNTDANTGNYQHDSTNNTDVFNDWVFDKIYFNSDFNEAKGERPDDITFYIQITNMVERNVQYQITAPTLSDDVNLNMDIYYYTTTNSDLSSNASDKGFFDISKSQAPNSVTFTEKKKEDMTKLTLTEGSSNSTTNKFPQDSEVTELNTVMICVSLSVKDIKEDLNPYDFRLVITTLPYTSA